MAKGRGGLGRGLESLFEDAAPSFESDTRIETLPLREIEPDPGQPRKTFDDETLAELSASIAEHGLLQPIAVRPKPSGGYLIVAGERRWRASRMAGLTEVPVIVKDVTDEQAMELALVENLQREDLDPVEEAGGARGRGGRRDSDSGLPLPPDRPSGRRSEDGAHGQHQEGAVPLGRRHALPL